jgi:hypothetical protein
LERDLAELFTELGEVAKQHDTRVVFLIDEMQFLKKDEMEAVAAAMHRMSQRRPPVAPAGTGLSQLPGLMVEAKSYAEFFHTRFETATPTERRYMSAGRPCTATR